MKSISEQLVQRAVEMLKDGGTVRQIAKILAIGIGSVSRIRRNMTGKVDLRPNGRPEKLTARNKRLLVRYAIDGTCDTAPEMQRLIRQNMSISISQQTIRNVLKKEGLVARVKKKKPLLTCNHRKQRLDFAKKYECWTTEDWKRVIFSDETRVNRLGSDGRAWTWKRLGSSIVDREVIPTLKFGGGGIMLWGCFTSQGVGYCCRIDGNMDATLYTSILSGEFLQTLDFYGFDRGSIVFQQDNDPKHTSKLAKSWFQTNGIQVLDWPSQSPDLNPIEHLWSSLKRKLNSFDTVASSVVELWDRIECEWEAIPADVCAGLIASMPNRIREVLKAKGGYTKY
jgi:transposase